MLNSTAIHRAAFALGSAVVTFACTCTSAKSSNALATPAPDTLTLAWEAEPRSLDPRYAVDANSQYLEDLLHCSLIDFDKDGRTVPDLAKAWRWETPTTVVLDLKEGMTFADGTPVTAQDVAQTYGFFKNDKAEPPSPRRSAFQKVKQVTARGKHSVAFDLTEPDSTFVTNLVVGILPERLAGKPMLTAKDDMPGCGPFSLLEADATHLLLKANPRYSPKPRTEQVAIKIVKDENTRYAKLLAGELDIVQNLVNRDKLAEIQKNQPRLGVLRRAGLNTAYLGFNMRDKVVGNPLVRQAIAYAIDKPKIVKYVLGGMATPADTLLPPNDPFHAKGLQNPGYDPEKAKTLLDQAGFKAQGSAPRLKLSYKTTTDLTRVAVAKAIASDLSKVGIDVTVETLEWGRFKADVDAGRVQIWSLSWIGFKDPDAYRFAFATESFPPNGGNRGWYSNPELDKLLAQGKAETDTKKRQVLYDQAQKLIAMDQPYVFLWHEEVFAVVNKAVAGFDLYADGRYSALAAAMKK